MTTTALRLDSFADVDTLVHDLDHGRLGQEHFHRNATFTVVAR